MDAIVWQLREAVATPAARVAAVVLAALLTAGLGLWVILAFLGPGTSRPDRLTAVAIALSAALAASLVGVLVVNHGFEVGALSAAQLHHIALLGAGAHASDRGTSAVTTFYTWRESQWSAVGKGLAGAAATLLVAVVPLVVSTGSTERTYAQPATSSSAPQPVPSSPPLSSIKVTEGADPPPLALWIGLVDLVVVAGFAMVYARREQRSYAHDMAKLGLWS